MPPKRRGIRARTSRKPDVPVAESPSRRSGAAAAAASGADDTPILRQSPRVAAQKQAAPASASVAVARGRRPKGRPAAAATASAGEKEPALPPIPKKAKTSSTAAAATSRGADDATSDSPAKKPSAKPDASDDDSDHPLGPHTAGGVLPGSVGSSTSGQRGGNYLQHGEVFPGSASTSTGQKGTADGESVSSSNEGGDGPDDNSSNGAFFVSFWSLWHHVLRRAFVCRRRMSARMWFSSRALVRQNCCTR